MEEEEDNMVQIIKGGPSRSQLWADLLGPALGEGLGNLAGDYYAGKSLKELLENPELKDADQATRMQALQGWAGKHGTRGQKMLQNQMQVEQQRQAQKEEKKATARNAAENKFISGQTLTPEEEAIVRPELKISFMKAQKPKGGITAQSVPEDVKQAIPQILNANKGANSDELAVAMDNAGIPRAFSNSYIENRRRQDEAKAKPENIKAELGVKRDSELLTEADKIRTLIPTEESALNAMEDAVVNGDQSFFSLDNLAEQTGFEWARTAKGGQFKTGAKTFLINNVTKFGARPNQYIEQQIADSLAKVGRDAEANLASMALTRFDSDVKKKYLETMDEIEAQGNYRPGTLGKETQNKMKDIVEKMQTELSNKLYILASKGALNSGEVYVYDKNGIIVGTVNSNEAKDLPKEYHVQ